MLSSHYTHLGTTLLLILCALSPVSAEDAKSAKQTEFFENKIRPVLVKHCYECHSVDSKELGGNLRLDTQAAMQKGGLTGPALVSGKPGESLLIKALKYDGVEMPPEEPLPEAVIHDFVQWIQQGAHDPRNNPPQVKPELLEDPESLWSFVPRKIVQPPAVNDRQWPRDRIDHFTLAKMEAAEIRPTQDADPQTLVRRLFIDLIGIPPTMEEVQSFTAAHAEHEQRAVEQLVDDLLSRPQFGERWGRHWLDVARYGESNGDDGLGRNATFPHAWRYRDYVIDALNRDVPYDRFLTEQIAGDLLPAESAEERNRHLVATGFLAIGSKPAVAMNKNFAMDVVNDQINVIGSGVLGLSVACARCHDHKHDPIPTRDYYALAGIFSSTETLYGLAANEKLTAPPTELHSLVKQWPVEQVAQAKSESVQFKADYASVIASLRPVLQENLDASPESLSITGNATFAADHFAETDEVKLRGELPNTPTDYTVSFWFRNTLKNDSRAITAYLFSLAPTGDKALPGDHIGIGGNHDGKRTGKLFLFNGNAQKKSLPGNSVIPPESWNHIVVVRQGDQVKLFLNGADKPEIAGELPSTIAENKQFTFASRSDDFAPLKGNLAHFCLFDRALQDDQVAILHSASGRPKSEPPLGIAMGVRDKSKIANAKIHINGDGGKLGDEVPRGILTAYEQMPEGLAWAASEEFSTTDKSSGRLELAKWLTDLEHPQTARVMVNRIWLHLFGQGLVNTPDDFGIYGARPSHPELLDDLANRFVEQSWSIKQMIRAIVLSRTYQLDSRSSGAVAEIDPDNKLYARHSRRRMDAETLRDAILHASGKLELTPANGSDIGSLDQLINWPPGESTNLHRPSTHRSVYLCMLRHAPPPELAAFNLPDGVEVVGMRSQTVLPTQALFLQNNPFVIQQARVLAERLLQRENWNDSQRIDELFQRTLQRLPELYETEQANRFLQTIQEERLKNQENDAIEESWSQLCQALMMTNEFRYID